MIVRNCLSNCPTNIFIIGLFINPNIDLTVLEADSLVVNSNLLPSPVTVLISSSPYSNTALA